MSSARGCRIWKGALHAADQPYHIPAEAPLQGLPSVICLKQTLMCCMQAAGMEGAAADAARPQGGSI